MLYNCSESDLNGNTSMKRKKSQKCLCVEAITIEFRLTVFTNLHAIVWFMLSSGIVDSLSERICVGQMMELELKKLYDSVTVVHEEMFSLREREEMMQHLIRSTNVKMATFSFFALIIYAYQWLSCNYGIFKAFFLAEKAYLVFPEQSLAIPFRFLKEYTLLCNSFLKFNFTFSQFYMNVMHLKFYAKAFYIN